MQGNVNVFVVASNRILIEGVKAILTKSEYEVAGSAYDVEQALDNIDRKVNFLIIDQGIKQLEDLNVIKKAKARNPDIRILAINGDSQADSIRSLIQSGANGYISRYVKETPLETAIDTMMHEDGYLCQLSTKIIADSLLKKEGIDPVQLTSREKKVIKLLAKEYSNREIAENLGISLRTVETYRKIIKKKIGARNVVGIVMYAVKHGLVEL